MWSIGKGAINRASTVLVATLLRITQGAINRAATALPGLLLCAVLSFAQESESSTTTLPGTVSAPADSITAPSDTLRSEATLDSTVTYSAERVEFTFDPRLTILTGDARVRYKSMDLTAGRIEIRWDEDLLFAEPIPEMVRARHPASTAAAIDSITWKGLPKMADGPQVITGRRMTYDIKSRRGRVIEGVTEYQDGFYHGRTIKRMNEETYNIRGGFYTTCNADDPHYGFWSHDMKMVVKDKVIARPLVLQFGPVPVAIVPFGVFPGRGGRHSGILVPTYGESSSQGRYFTGLGYYFAPNDYLDARASLDFYERFGILLRGDGSYARRYLYRGGLSGSYINQQREGVATRRWDLQVNHGHNLSPSANLNVNAYFVSDKSFLRDVSQNANRRLQKTIRSDATLNKRWPNTPYSATVNLHREEDLETANIDQALPRLFFSRSQTPIIPPPEGQSKDDARWWNLVYYNYGGSGVNTSTTRTTELPDGREIKTTRDRSGIRHDLTFTASQKPFGYVALTPSFSYSEAWFDEWLDYVWRPDSTVETKKHNEFRARRTFSTGAGLSTRLYGLFHPGVAGVEALRHTLSPSVSFSYTPDFSDRKWDYYEVFTDTIGRKVYYDRFAGSVVGGTPQQEQMALGISVDNLFEYKRRVGDKEVKGELFSLGLSTGHNFTADSMKWGDLGSSLRIKPLVSGSGASLSGLGLDVTARHSFYAQENGITVDRGAPGLLRLLGFDLTTSLRLQGGAATQRPQQAADTTLATGVTEDRFAAKTWKPSPLPWSAGVSLRYGETRPPPPTRPIRNAWAALNVEVKATQNWRINSDLRIDLVNQRIVSTGVSLYRDLHCWEGRFTWNPVGAFSGYYLIISVKSPHLKDVKVEKREGGGGFFGL